MEIRTKRGTQDLEKISFLMIKTSLGSEFRIQENKFGELVINKSNDGQGDSIKIQPIMSNEIIIK